MKTHLNPTHAVFALTAVLATIFHFPVLLRCQVTPPYDICRQSVRCGEIEFEYPFWGSDRPEYCGHPDFQLTCQSNVSVLRLDSVDYRVRDTDSSTNTITVARNDLWNTNCPEYLHNTTYNSSLFNDDNYDQENVSLYYRCEDNIPPNIWQMAPDYKFDCTTNGTTTDSYFITSSIASNNSSNITNFVGHCNSSITVSVERTWADRLASPAGTEDDLRSGLQAGFKLRWMANNDDCDQCIRSRGECGSNSTSPELFVCYCSSGDFALTCDNSDVSGGGSSGTTRKLIIVITCSFTGIMILLFVILCRKARLRITTKGQESANHQIEIFIRNHGHLAPKRYKYSEIKKMTNTFLNKLGQGGYGSVYKGQLPDGHAVAVKLLSEATGNGEDFINEVASISRTSHVNIVTLLGFCFEGKKRALLYEYMPNGSLDKFLRSDGSHLDWDTLFQISKGIARGLEYLHRGCNTRIVHFDIKPHNILLDEEFVPKISDFGLAKLCKKKGSIVSVMGARGTAGYMAPEVFFKTLGGASHKSDVYSYGMMVLEMTGARKNVNANNTSASEAYFPEWICKQVEAGSNLEDYGVTNEEEVALARRMMIVGLWCIQYDPSDRPSINKVVEMLEGSLESLQAPPRHFWSSPTRSVQSISQLDTLSSNSDRLLMVQEMSGSQ